MPKELPEASLATFGERGFGLYVHVPFCASRCGYCDFNTYTASELGPHDAVGASRATYVEAVIAELDYAFDTVGAKVVDTVFFGGGTPTLLPAAHLVRIVSHIEQTFGLAPGVEITTEANPDSVDVDYLHQLRTGGINRISFGMQSDRPHVLALLDRTHDRERVADAVGWAREAGFEQVSLDLIYGTPGESIADWAASLAAALACQPDHISAYALIVEDGTALARKVARGELPRPDDDDLADKYLLCEETLTNAGLKAYELSNWAAREDSQCAHNRIYWTSGDWWGVGPGAHSHAGGVRWWNHKHPVKHAGLLNQGQDPEAGREMLDEPTRLLERVMLELRLAEGVQAATLAALAGPNATQLVQEQEALGRVVRDGSAVRLTLEGRLLADAVVRAITCTD